jgi:hypothetical protein
MVTAMFTTIIKQHKIFNPIITNNTVNMVYYFFFSKIATDMFFHNKTMFRYISVIIMGMFGSKNKDISRPPHRSSPNPSGMILPKMFSFFKLCSFRNALSFLDWFSPFFANLCIVKTSFGAKSSTTLRYFPTRDYKSFLTSFTYCLNIDHFISQKKAAFRSLMETRLSVAPLLAADFDIKNPCIH